MIDEKNFFYANAIEVAYSPYDVSLKFQRNGADASSSSAAREVMPKTLNDFIISMSPGHLKAMLPALYRAVCDYERKYGEMPLPQDVRKEYDAAFGAR